MGSRRMLGLKTMSTPVAYNTYLGKFSNFKFYAYLPSPGSLQHFDPAFQSRNLNIQIRCSGLINQLFTNLRRFALNSSVNTGAKQREWGFELDD